MMINYYLFGSIDEIHRHRQKEIRPSILTALDPFYLYITLTLMDVAPNSYLAYLPNHIVVLYHLWLQL
jgi:hypothetical protein